MNTGLLTSLIMNIPNILTLFRLFLIPIFILVFFSSISNSLLFSILIFLVAGLTDILDGYIARKFNLITKWGMVLDPLADKLMLIAVLACLAIYNYAPIWVLILVTLKEVFMIISGILLYRKNIVIPSNIFGKITTALFYLSIFLFSINTVMGHYLLYIAVISAFISLINYFVIYSKDKKSKTNLLK